MNNWNKEIKSSGILKSVKKSSRISSRSSQIMKNSIIKLFLALFVVSLAGISGALKEGDCEVCIKTIEKFASSLDEATKKDPKKIETEFRKYCKTSKTKENRFVSSRNINDDVVLVFCFLIRNLGSLQWKLKTCSHLKRIELFQSKKFNWIYPFFSVIISVD